MARIVTVVYWSVLISARLVFKRAASLSVTASEVVCPIGRMPRRARVVRDALHQAAVLGVLLNPASLAQGLVD